MPSARLHRISLVVLLVTFILAFFLRTFPLTFSHYWDEAVYLQNAKVISEGRTNYSELSYRPPMLSVFFAAGFLLWDNVYVANIVEGLLTSLVVLFSYLLVRSIWGEVTAIVVAVLFAFSPYIVEQSHQLMSDFPAVSLMTASLLLFTRGRKSSFFFSGVLYSLSVLTRFTSIFLLVYFALFVIVFRKNIKILVPFFLGAVLCMLPFLAWAQYNYGSFLFPFVHARRVITEWSGYIPPSVFFHGIREIFPLIVSVGLIAGIVKIVVSLSRQLARSDRTLLERLSGLDDTLRHELLLLSWGSLFFIYMLTIPHKETRYLAPLVIPVLVLSAAGVVYMYKTLRERSKFILATVVVVLIALAVRDFYPLYQRLEAPLVDDSVYGSVAIAQYLEEISGPGDTIYAVTNFPVLAFYSSRKTVSLLEVKKDSHERWREFMNAAGFYVYFTLDAEKDVLFQKDFLDKTKNFEEINNLGDTIVYRYSPSS